MYIVCISSGIVLLSWVWFVAYIIRLFNVSFAHANQQLNTIVEIDKCNDYAHHMFPIIITG